MPDAQPKPTAAEVVAKHLNCQWRHGVHLDCGAPLPPAGPDFRAAHVAERLTAAGLLATPERGSGPEPEREAVGRLLWDQRGGSLRPGSWDDPVLFTEEVKESWRRQADEVLSSRWLAEHDAQVAAQALRDLVADRADIETALSKIEGSEVSVVDLIVHHATAPSGIVNNAKENN